MRQNNLKEKNKSHKWAVISLIFTTFAALAISIYCMNRGWFIVHQNLLYIPIVISCMFFNKKGFIFSTLLSFVYFVLILYFAKDSVIIWLALVRAFIFVTIAGTITFWAINHKHSEEIFLNLLNNLQNSEDKYRSLFISSRDAITTLEPPLWNFTSGNPATIKMFGVKNEAEFLTYEPWQLSPKYQPDGQASVEKAKDIIETAMREGSHFFEWTHKRANGEEFPANVLLSRVDMKKGALLYVTIRDITENKRIENALRTSKACFHNIVNKSTDGVVVVDQDGIVRYANPAVETLLDRKAEELIGQQVSFSIAENETVELDIIRHNKERVISEMTSVETKWEGQKARLVLIRDITSRKNTELELKKANNILEMTAKVSQDIFLIKDRRQLLTKICERIVEYAYKMVWIGFCDEKTKSVVPEAQAGFEEGYLKSVKITYDETEYGTGPTGAAIKTKKPCIMRFIDTNPKYEPWRQAAIERGYRSSAAIPIFEDECVIGTLNVYAEQEDAFGEKELNLLEDLSKNLSVALKGISEETMRKEAEIKLSQTAKEWQITFDSISDFVFIQDKNLTITKANKACFDAIKAKPEDIIGRKCYEVLHKKNSPFPGCPSIEAMKDQKYHTAEIFDRSIGIPLLVTVSPIFNDNGELVGGIHIAKDITAIRQAEEKLRETLGVKETLLRELHHRVKNNMQVISSFLRLQSRKIDDRKTAEIFRECQDRIQAMALIHEKFYHSEDLSNIDFETYVKELTLGLVQSYNNSQTGIAINIDIKDISLRINDAIICGLIINELVSNSLKYAFPHKQKGKIDISMQPAGKNKIEFTVSDNGIGIPAKLDLQENKTFGLQLVNSFVKDQLDGTIELDKSNGTKFSIKFKKKIIE